MCVVQVVDNFDEGTNDNRVDAENVRARQSIEVERAARVAADRVRAMDSSLSGSPLGVVKRHVYPTILFALRCLHR